MAKATPKKTAKPAAKKAPAPAKKTVKTKAVTKAKPAVKKTAKPAAKKPMSASALKKVEDVRKLAKGLIVLINTEVKDAAKGTANPDKSRRILKAMKVAMMDAIMDEYRK